MLLGAFCEVRRLCTRFNFHTIHGPQTLRMRKTAPASACAHAETFVRSSLALCYLLWCLIARCACVFELFKRYVLGVGETIIHRFRVTGKFRPHNGMLSRTTNNKRTTLLEENSTRVRTWHVFFEICTFISYKINLIEIQYLNNLFKYITLVLSLNCCFHPLGVAAKQYLII